MTSHLGPLAHLTRGTRRARRIARLATALVVCVPNAAAAQTGTLPKRGNVLGDVFEPAPVGDPFLSQISAVTDSTRQLSLGLIGSYARRPVVLYNSDDNEAGALLSDRLVLHVAATARVGRRLTLDADFPVALLSAGDDTAGFTAPSHAAAGDLRVGARLRALALGPVQVAVCGRLWLPTGDESELSGAGAVRAGPSLIVSGSAGAFIYTANGGVAFGPDSTFAGTQVDDRLTFGAAIGATLTRALMIGVEIGGAAVLRGPDAFSSTTTNLEMLFGGTVRAGDLRLGAGAGPGVAGGVGTPSVRGVLSASYEPARDDRDHDGIDDDDDACRYVPGERSPDRTRNGCPNAPPTDRDSDGILDEPDACPDSPGIATGDPATHGCADADGDGIYDAWDACPTRPGVRSENPRNNGCLRDLDGDTIADERDACPDLAGVTNLDPTKHGCPPDRDSDAIADRNDACPDTPGVPSPKRNGCPADDDSDGVPNDRDACPAESGAADPDPTRSGCPAPAKR